MTTQTKKGSLIFRVISHPSGLPSSAKRTAFLVKDNWDDWGKYQTQFFLVLFDSLGKRHEPGAVKIAQRPKVEKGYWRTVLPDQFAELDSAYFSLGQDESYYWTLMAMNDDRLKDQVLGCLRDLVVDQQLWRTIRNDSIVRESLLRYVKPRTVEKQFRRIVSGGERLTPYNLIYTGPPPIPLTLSFDVRPNEEPPTNVHVLIGPNGVGKTFLLQQMTKALLVHRKHKRYGTFITKNEENGSAISNVVSVSFSAFDHFVSVQERKPTKSDVLDYLRYSYVGLKRASGAPSNARGNPKTAGMLATEFVNSLWACLNEPRLSRWRRAITGLETDVIFKSANVSSLVQYRRKEELLKKLARRLFRSLSAGHKLVLLTTTRLVELVDEQTLVLFDEPEAHLHPPLLSAFLRVISELLINRNGLAIMATHSPVVLQEVPKICVWVLRRAGHDVRTERPEFETFGENVGVITREVFGLEVTNSGFYGMLRDVVEPDSSVDSAYHHFSGQLGGEARAILHGLFVNRDRENNSH
jgi:ABC-type molybdenum transport system ATPase subunit/photorepair protein PhrA